MNSVKNKVDLSRFDNAWYGPGRSWAICIIWYCINAIFVQNPLNPFSAVRVFLLRIFGAKIGKGVVLKPSLNVKYPWNLQIGDYSWIGEMVWLDSLAPIRIGHNACISQGAYLCTGNHDWSEPTFGLIIEPIVVEDGAWLGAKTIVLPGVNVGSHSVITAGTVISKDTEPYMIYSGNPAKQIKKRLIKDDIKA